ncbi:MAG: sigma-54 dependent transcriptional regulator [Nitrospirota bacterium]|jgi:two-component system nitrogen regulation response regulator NtrX
MADSQVLIIDDEAGIRESLADILTDEGYRVVTARSGEEALSHAGERLPDVVVLDVWLPSMDGLDVLERIKGLSAELPVIMISGHGTIETAVRATRMGAYDFLEKPLSLEKVVLTVGRALERRSLEEENRQLRESLQKKCLLVGESAAMQAVRSQVAMAARSNSRVLITGESGVGKEIVARLLHEQGPRARAPFVAVNCAAIPQELIESELFGHEKGSFTGAFEQKKGKFETADGGTLLLDEIADMSFQTQAKLLRVLENQQFQRVGGSRSIQVDVRVIAATNKDLEERIRKEEFRADLYFRLNVIPIHVPPLRERKEDIPLLVEHFLGTLAAEYGQAPKKVSREAVRKLMEHDWPGNIRELRNLIERLVIMTPAETISAEGLTLGEGEAEEADYYRLSSLRDAREAFEKDFISRKLKDYGWNVSRTAEAMGIERSNLHRKIKAFGIRLPGAA